jgi:hypothetical protein
MARSPRQPLSFNGSRNAGDGMLPAMAVATVLVLAIVTIHYEALRLISRILPRLTMLAPRQRLIVVLLAVFAAHTVEVWVYALAYYGFDHWIDIGGFGGVPLDGIADYVYFSTVTFSTLGFGDVVPHGGLRLVAGVEAVNGFLMIGWSASYTYIAMSELWNLHDELAAARRQRREQARSDRGGSP